MTLWLAICGWTLASALALQAARLARRLDLVARADHELRGPLGALTLAVEALGRRPELRRRASALEAHLDRLRLGLEDLSEAQAGRRAPVRRAEVRLDHAARSVAEAWEPAAREAGSEVSFRWRAGPLVARTDRARLSQALGNALANAVEHGGRRIEVAGERRGEGVEIAVRDEGRPRPSQDHGGAANVPGAGRRGRGLGIAARAAEDLGASLEAPHLGRRPRAQRESRGSPNAPTEVSIEVPVRAE